jgi:hypothetical protein
MVSGAVCVLFEPGVWSQAVGLALVTWQESGLSCSVDVFIFKLLREEIL